MHREILGVPDGLFADHVSGDRLDNRRHNLRIATKAQNGYNRTAIKRNKLGAKGISYDPDRRKYRVRLSLEGHCFQLGRCHSLSEAKELYRAGAAFFHGDFARVG